MANRILYYYNSPVADIFNLISGGTKWVAGDDPPSVVTGYQNITFVIRSHGSRGSDKGNPQGLIGGKRALTYANGVYNQLVSKIKSRINCIIFLVCHAGNDFSNNNPFNDVDRIYAPDNTLLNSGSGSLSVKDAKGSVALTVALKNPNTRLDGAPGWVKL